MKAIQEKITPSVTDVTLTLTIDPKTRKAIAIAATQFSKVNRYSSTNCEFHYVEGDHATLAFFDGAMVTLPVAPGAKPITCQFANMAITDKSAAKEPLVMEFAGGKLVTRIGAITSTYDVAHNDSLEWGHTCKTFDNPEYTPKCKLPLNHKVIEALHAASACIDKTHHMYCCLLVGHDSSDTVVVLGTNTHIMNVRKVKESWPEDIRFFIHHSIVTCLDPTVDATVYVNPVISKDSVTSSHNLVRIVQGLWTYTWQAENTLYVRNNPKVHERVTPSPETLTSQVVFNKRSMLSALDSVKPVAKNIKGRRVTIDICRPETDTIVISAVDDEKRVDRSLNVESVKVDSDKWDIHDTAEVNHKYYGFGFNFQYLTTILKNIEDTSVVMLCVDCTGPIVFVGETDIAKDNMFVGMPMAMTREIKRKPVTL